MTIKARTWTTTLVTLALLTGAGAVTLADTYTAHVDSPVVIGDQLYPGGTVVVQTVGASGQLLAVEIDGRRVALIYHRPFERRVGSGRADVVFQRDERGFFHLAAWNAGRPDTSPHPVAVAALSAGVATVPDYRPLTLPEGQALARR
ncbi:MAG: hypothetical protein Q9Q40_02235 [Acidobacteriota bacterium]|nr:hypothetical protein [Acidobacteriota bacterium]MDQ7088544.1 hypothetical protein [Acidobacteriota bacterium]